MVGVLGSAGAALGVAVLAGLVALAEGVLGQHRIAEAGAVRVVVTTLG